mmetsp:Transcript_11502/g.30516  ORF Transcript_11502/g.30516 Transcript_11502/m.30516 type:complete len:201 (+) Transcript_11502:819-1421(+)
MLATNESSLCAPTSTSSSCKTRAWMRRVSVRHEKMIGTNANGERRNEPAAPCRCAAFRMRQWPSVSSAVKRWMRRETGPSSAAVSTSIGSGRASSVSTLTSGSSESSGLTSCSSLAASAARETTPSCSMTRETSDEATSFCFSCDRCEMSGDHSSRESTSSASDRWASGVITSLNSKPVHLASVAPAAIAAAADASTWSM